MFHLLFFVNISNQLYNDEHRHSVTTTSRIIRKKSIVKSKVSLLCSNLPDRLKGRLVRILPSLWIHLLTRHTILRRLKGHGSKRIQQTGRHRRTKHIRNRILLLIQFLHVELFELIQCRDLEDPDHHRALDEGGGSPPEGGDSFFFDDALGCVGYALVISAFVGWEGDVVGHSDDGYFGWA